VIFTLFEADTPLGVAQVRVYVVLVVMLSVVVLPLVASLPDQPPDAEQLLALGADQVKVV
jgi:hypothetical protein